MKGVPKAHAFPDRQSWLGGDRGLGNRLILEEESGSGTSGPIQCRQRLGGMLNYYYREAA
jgi:hypothetical protein